MSRRSGTLLAAALATAALGGAVAAAPLPPGAKYVAMGSSYAAGPGVGAPAEGPPHRCAQSADNYAHQLARRRAFALTDVSCSGATTSNILGPSLDLPPQIDAVDASAQLVTLTIGGNDLNYVGGLVAASCVSAAEVASAAGKPSHTCPDLRPPTEAAYRGLEARLRNIAAEVRRRAPAARLVFVQYPVVLPRHGSCAAAPLSEADADASRRVAARLAEITDRVAKQGGAEVMQTQLLSIGHDACAEDPWMNGYPQPGERIDGVFYHPNLEGMTAMAKALDRMLR